MSLKIDGTKRSTVRPALAVAVLALIIAMALMVAACGSDAEDSVTASTTSTTGAGTAATAATSGDASTTTTTGPDRVVVGGKTAEEYAASLPELQKAVEANPTDLVALQTLAVAQYNSGKLDEAAATYLKMLEVKDDPTVHNNYANVLRDQKKLDEATAQYLKAIDGDAALTAAYINLAAIYLGEENIVDAEKILDQGIAHTVGEDKTRLEDYKTSISKGS
jgi:Flp pilus assembly protein TadD